MKKTRNISCWVVTEGMAGTENQCLGVTDALNIQPEIKRINLKQPWKTFSPFLKFEQSFTFSPPLTHPWPDLLIASGRKAISAARYIKTQSQGKTFTVFLQDPRIDPSIFDLVAVPAHDPTRGENVIVTDVAPNRITHAKLAAAKSRFTKINALKSPRIAVLIGGKSKAYDMNMLDIQTLITQLISLREKQNVSLMITASRRTGQNNIEKLHAAFPESAQTVFWNGEGDNPYTAYLANADAILVSADSVSMISDALATGVPTYVIPLKGGGRRLDLFHAHILERGLVKKFNGELVPYTYLPVRASEKIATEICNKMGLSAE